MKKLFTFFLLLIAMTISAQEASQFTETYSDRPRDPRDDQMDFVPNEVLVKFKDNVQLKSGTILKSSGITAVDKLLGTYNADALEKLFPGETKLKSVKIVKDPQGQDMKIPSLHNIYKIKIPQTKSSGSIPVYIFQFIEELKALAEVEYAEPNYIFSIDDLEPAGPILTANEVEKLQKDNRKSSKDQVIPNDPLYSQQWYIPAVKAEKVWEQTTGDTTQIIAILDTGVDWNHPDLKNKIWRNKQEIPGNGIDDDGNGLIDDIRGWDYINNDNNPTDDNSHGTHVAGIAAAEANNGIGIAGVNWHAKIMPIKVFPHNGGSDIGTIVQGINYAINNGATILNMSFGSYAPSLTLESVLQNALAKDILLVAAAGNDHYNIYDFIQYIPFASHPAALSYVFGVQSDGDYSNYDPDGPVFSNVPQGYNYELKAPGKILSTVPNGNYRNMIGTSMATPIVSGALALYRTIYPEKTLEEIWSAFIHSSTNIIDVNEAIFGTSGIPKLDILSYEILDINEDCDNDTKADAGETIDLRIQVRNTGTPATGVYAKIQQNNDGNPLDLTILKDSVFYGNIGIYRSLKNESDPFKVKISDECGNNSTVLLDVSIYNSNSEIVDTQKLNFKIFNGAEISGILLRDTTFTKNKYWVITNSLRISGGITLTIEPGTSVEILQGIDNRGKVVAIGTPEERIKLKGFIGGDAKYKYVDFDLGGKTIETDRLDYCNIVNVYDLRVRHLSYCKIENITYATSFSDTIYRCLFKDVPRMCIYTDGLFFSENVLDNCEIEGSSYYPALNELMGRQRYISYNVFNNISNRYVRYYPNSQSTYINNPALLMRAESSVPIISNSFLTNNIATYFLITSGGEDQQTVSNQYWGTNDPIKIRKKYYDFMNNAGLPYLNYEPKLVAPSDSCQAHVWKILVNGRDAQDEIVDPVGIGRQRFDIYFNRSMKKNIRPQVSFGGKYPYTSIPINEDGFWSEDGRIYTVFKTIKLTTGDGINRIRVAGAKQDANWGWEIPIENMRFGFIISAANSASLEFMATPSLGKVKLEWNNNTLADGLGFNMYRMEHVNDSVLTNPVLVNSSLITDTLYTDFAVTPNKKYYYYYKILRTNLMETDSSRVVSATPFTASKGDANGDLKVNVLDITTIVAYLLNHNPQPFIMEAADLNSDGSINVLDIVGVVNLILNDGKKSAELVLNEPIQLYIESDTLFVDAPVAIGGIQFDISGVSSMDEIQRLIALDGFESGYAETSNGLRVLFYSMSGKTIPAGNRIPLLKLKDGSAILKAIFADKNGASIPVHLQTTGVWNLSDILSQTVAELGQNFPNPLTQQTTIPIRINEPIDAAIIRIFNMYGQEVEALRVSNPTIGEHLLQWNSEIKKGLFTYRLEIIRGKDSFISPARKMIVQ